MLEALQKDGVLGTAGVFDTAVAFYPTRVDETSVSISMRLGESVIP